MISPKIESRGGQSLRQIRDLQLKTDPFSECFLLGGKKPTDGIKKIMHYNFRFCLNFAEKH